MIYIVINNGLFLYRQNRRSVFIWFSLLWRNHFWLLRRFHREFCVLQYFRYDVRIDEVLDEDDYNDKNYCDDNDDHRCLLIIIYRCIYIFICPNRHNRWVRLVFYRLYYNHDNDNDNDNYNYDRLGWRLLSNQLVSSISLLINILLFMIESINILLFVVDSDNVY